MKYRDEILALMDQQQEKGLRKYGTYLEDNPRPVVEAIDAMAQELIDGLQYFMEIKDKLSRPVDKPTNGDWIETYTGKQFWPLNPNPADVCIEDIAHALSLVCRYTGHSRFFYSVAQHSILCAQLAEYYEMGKRMQLLALLHDASEAYIADIAKPLKPFIVGYKDMERGIQRAVFEGLGIEPPTQDEEWEIKGLDRISLVIEARQLMPLKSRWGCLMEIPADLHIDAAILEMPVRVTENGFMGMYEVLKKSIDEVKEAV